MASEYNNLLFYIVQTDVWICTYSFIGRA